MPERESLQLKFTSTSVLFQPAAFAGGRAVAVMVGGVSSKLRVSDEDAVFPARSAAVPVMIWPAPSWVTVTGGVQEAMPEVLSEQAKLTTTLPLFQPKEFAAGSAEAVMMGRSLSIPSMVITTAVPRRPTTSTPIVLDSFSVAGFSTVNTAGRSSRSRSP